MSGEVFAPKPLGVGMWPESVSYAAAAPAPVPGASSGRTGDLLVQPVVAQTMGLGAGGQVSQRIYSDPYGIETWDEAARAELFIHIVSPQTWYALTGEPPPPTPVTYRAYQAAGLPWFQIYDEYLPGIGPAPELEKIRSIDDLDRRR